MTDEVRKIASLPTFMALQTRMGPRQAYAVTTNWETTSPEALANFITAQTSVFLATVNTAGQPCV